MIQPYSFFEELLDIFIQSVESIGKQIGFPKWLKYSEKFSNDSKNLGLKGIKTIDEDTFVKLEKATEIINANRGYPQTYWDDLKKWLGSFYKDVLPYVFDFYTFIWYNKYNTLGGIIYECAKIY